jgi:hypothetical protein
MTEGAGFLLQLIEIARTVPRKGHLPPLQAEIKGRNVMLTIAITVAWLSVALIYLMAASDRRTSCY